ncbi:hypothetical protein CTAYLR_004603 [Chrysophaeum taylorii]|uniref:Uncharacterized protein n=1 Tax=Chrysophaeum taylorii TaxID=2483200 RepID=A0AAD7UDJ3_9STRA|nr:hypothetical protein CTAYLR_004603 [Chrysophaeum taylorii]
MPEMALRLPPRWRQQRAIRYGATASGVPPAPRRSGETFGSAVVAILGRIKGLFFHDEKVRWTPSRILLRDAYDHQSMGRWNIKRVGGYWVSMYLDDWFNTIVHLPFARLLVVMCLFYIVIVSIFAVAYLSFAEQCGMDFADALEAYYFSLETMATIGYGTKDYFFGHCWEPLVLINLQVTASLVVESLYFGIIFHRLTRGRKRTNTVLFSDKAVVRRVADAYYLIFQVCEMRRHHLLDARVRVFAVRHERDAHGGTAYYQAHRMALKRPNDATGGMLLMALPQLVVHKLDATSPLVPSTTWMSASGPRHWPGVPASVGDAVTSPGPRAPAPARNRNPPRHRRLHSNTMFVPYHQPDDDNFSEKYNSGQSLYSSDAEENKRKRKKQDLSSRHLDVDVNKALDRAAEVMSSPEPSPRSAKKFDDESLAATSPGGRRLENEDGATDADRESDQIRRNMEYFMRDREIEVIAIVEGNDEYTSRLVQARHSYTSTDLAWWRNFAPCVFRQNHGACVVDFSEFHRTVRNPPLGGGSYVSSPTHAYHRSPLSSGHLPTLWGSPSVSARDLKVPHSPTANSAPPVPAANSAPPVPAANSAPAVSALPRQFPPPVADSNSNSSYSTTVKPTTTTLPDSIL